MATGAVTDSVSVRRNANSFVWAYLGGIVAIVTIKLIDPWHPVVVGFVASAAGIIIMAFYAALQKRSRPENEHPRLGDEVYYLGLLYTLTTLCVALVMLFLLQDGVPIFGQGRLQALTLVERTDRMIGSFGIALLTTIAGIVIRMTLQGRGSGSEATIIRIPHPGVPAERQSGVRGAGVDGPTVDLERFAYELRRQLQNSTNAFVSHANQAILQAKTVHAHMDEMMRKFHDGLEERARTGLERMEAIYVSIAGRAEEALIQTEAQQERVHYALEKLESHVTSMDESIERIRVGSGEVAENLGAVGTQAKASVRAFVEGGRAVADGLGALAAATAEEEANHRIRTQFATEIQELLGQQAKDWTGVRRRASEALGELERTNQALAGLGQVTRRTNQELVVLPDVLHKAGDALERVAELSSAGRDIVLLKDQAKALTEEFIRVAGAGKRHEEALDATVEKLQALAKVAGHEVDSHARLTEAIATIAELAATAGRHGASLMDTEREIQGINMVLKGVRNAMEDEGPRLAEILKQAIVAVDEARARSQGTRSVLDRVFRR